MSEGFHCVLFSLSLVVANDVVHQVMTAIHSGEGEQRLFRYIVHVGTRDEEVKTSAQNDGPESSPQ